MNTTRTNADSLAAGAETDVIVLGVGTCGEDLSLRLLGAGLDVVGIEAALVGGECAYWACLPSKVMIRAANALQEARRVDGLAGHADVRADWSPVASRVRDEVAGGWQDTFAVQRFESRGGRLVHGFGRLTSRRSVVVDGQAYTARRGIVIATGSKPVHPPIPGLADGEYWTTHDVIQAAQLPASLLIIGGGTVGCELGQVLARFGVDITIVEAGPRLLPGEEPESSAVVAAAFAEEGIHVNTGAPAERVEWRDGSVRVTLSGGRQLTGERLLVAAGRRVDLGGLGLEAVGLDAAASFIAVDDRMRATDGIWAMGDVTGKAMFTHVALHQSAIVAAALLGVDHPPASYHAVPRVTFTDPEVAAVGISEAAARAAGHDIVVVVKQLSATFRGWLHRAGHGIIKLVAERGTGTLLGATVVGPGCGEVLGMLTLAVHARLPLSAMRNMIYAFPTFHGGVGEAIGASGRGLSTVIDPEYRGHEVLDSA
jgi:pyruvate/2-oxoglutarate dehydrogenase complex dihydrolipoamide dehydrogenase (E3) component